MYLDNPNIAVARDNIFVSNRKVNKISKFKKNKNTIIKEWRCIRVI